MAYGILSSFMDQAILNEKARKTLLEALLGFERTYKKLPSRLQSA
jgi:hypothetical protein